MHFCVFLGDFWPVLGHFVSYGKQKHIHNVPLETQIRCKGTALGGDMQERTRKAHDFGKYQYKITLFFPKSLFFLAHFGNYSYLCSDF